MTSTFYCLFASDIPNDAEIEIDLILKLTYDKDISTVNLRSCMIDFYFSVIVSIVYNFNARSKETIESWRHLVSLT